MVADRVYGRNFGRIPDELLWDKSVSSDACRLYGALTRYSQQRDRVAPGRKELAERLGWSLRHLDRKVAELGQVGALYVERRPGVKGESRTQESIYWLDGRRPSDSPDARGSDSLDAIDSDSPDATKRRERTSPNGDGGEATDGRAETIVGRAVNALGFTPVERGAFAKIITEAAKTVSSEDLLLRAVREWGRAGEPVTYLTGRIGTMDREARARVRRNGNGHGGAVAVRHDGKHDQACWCYDVPEEQRAKVQRGDLLRAAGLKPKTAEEVQAQIDAEDAQARAEGHCCASHTRTCEPPSELCCEGCSEARHPEHPDGVPCVSGVTSE